MWILFAFFAPALYAVAEIFDEYLSNRGVKSITPLIFYGLLMNFVFLPVLILLFHPSMPPKNLILPLLGVALTDLLYLYPYYKSLKIEDTSIVSAFFSLGKIIIPIFAFVFVGEVLTFKEYLGIGIIIFGNVFLALHSAKKKIRLSKAFYMIIFASTVLAIEGILFKYMFEHGLEWSTALMGQLFLAAVIGCVSLLLVKKTRREIFMEKIQYKKLFQLFLTEELFTFLGMAAETYAISLAPVSLVKGIGMSIPIFVLSFTVAVKRLNPKAFREDTRTGAIFKKVFIFAFIIIGLVLVGVND